MLVSGLVGITGQEFAPKYTSRKKIIQGIFVLIEYIEIMIIWDTPKDY